MAEAEAGVHVALVVEDDPHVSATLVELVESLGHAARTATTLRDATTEIERGGYCYVLLDMQIPASTGKTPLMSAGRTALGLLRKRAPERAASGAWALPILVVTAYARDHEFVGDVFEEGASGFVAKPFEKGIDAVGAKILAALARSERAGHEACGEKTQGRGGEPVSGAKTGKLHLSIPGVDVGRRMKIVVNGKGCFLQPKAFVLLLRLVGLAATKPGRFHERTALKFDHVPQLPSRIRKAISEGAGIEHVFVECDAQGRYRLHPDVVVEEVAWSVLVDHGDADVARVAGEYGSGS